jgi:hypothetical protein
LDKPAQIKQPFFPTPTAAKNKPRLLGKNPINIPGIKSEKT